MYSWINVQRFCKYTTFFERVEMNSREWGEGAFAKHPEVQLIIEDRTEGLDGVSSLTRNLGHRWTVANLTLCKYTNWIELHNFSSATCCIRQVNFKLTSSAQTVSYC